MAFALPERRSTSSRRRSQQMNIMCRSRRREAGEVHGAVGSST